MTFRIDPDDVTDTFLLLCDQDQWRYLTDSRLDGWAAAARHEEQCHPQSGQARGNYQVARARAGLPPIGRPPTWGLNPAHVRRDRAYRARQRRALARLGDPDRG